MKDLCPSELKETKKAKKRHIPVVYNGSNYRQLWGIAFYSKFCIGIHRMDIFLLARYYQLTLICLTGEID